MDEPDPADAGVIASLRRGGASLVSLLRTRFEILSVELQEEKLGAIRLLTWLAAAIAVGFAGVMLLIGILSLFLWQRFGYPGVIALAVLTLGCSAAMLWSLRRRILTGPRPFATTLTEIEKDLQCLQTRE